MLQTVVIGGGPAGYATAIGLAQGGAGAILVEEDQPGGTCLHRGCIPSKSLLESARLAREMRQAAERGLLAGPVPALRWAAVRERQDGAVRALASGLAQLLRANGVRVVHGHAALLAPEAAGRPPGVAVTGPEAGTFHPEAVVLAPGSVPARPPVPGLELPGVCSSDDLLAAPAVPRRLAIIGGGAVGCELASAHAAFGAKVCVLEALGQLLPAADPEVARRLEAAFRRGGIAVHTGARVLAVEAGPVVRADTPQGTLELAVDAVLVATGRRARTEGLGLEAAGIARTDAGAIVVDAGYRCPGAVGVWAVGDAAGAPGLAHAAFRQAETVAAAILGGPAPAAAPIPWPVFCHPEVAWVGASEGERVARVPFAALGRAHAAGDTDGLCKLVADADGRVRGVHLLGRDATELIGAGALVVARGLTLDDLAGTVFPHPTLCEGLGEAAHLALGRPLHLAPRRTS